jgi:hypothetical protein
VDVLTLRGQVSSELEVSRRQTDWCRSEASDEYIVILWPYL